MKTTVRAVLLVVVLCAIGNPSSAQSPAVDWGPLNFLLGDWVGEGSGQPGQGSGGSSFSLDLQKRVMVRKNWAQYPATKDRPAFLHEDLMITYRDSEKEPFKAIYFDNEGHVVHYVIQVSAGENSIQFLSEASPGSPGYRLTYFKTGPNRMNVKFEIAPPGKPDSFSTYITAEIRRKE